MNRGEVQCIIFRYVVDDGETSKLVQRLVALPCISNSADAFELAGQIFAVCRKYNVAEDGICFMNHDQKCRFYG